ncbi:MAG TPA: hypothetical protein VD999_04890 [Vitreimonas sp.]|nr:hypothetical protein [Vitreimonas sp.]
MTLLKTFDGFVRRNLGLVFWLVTLLILRLPNYCEPYWYGDEGIYLTIGLALRHGQRLYLDIVDHKTPLIYYLAMVPHQFWFRILNTVWMLVTTVAFWSLVKRLMMHPWARHAAMALFVIMTTIPTLEGNLPNGELFVMGFVMVGAWWLSKTQLFTSFIDQTPLRTQSLVSASQSWWLLAAGFSFGLGLMTKVPALFDWAGFAVIGWFLFWQTALNFQKSFRERYQDGLHIVMATGLFGVGFFLPLLLSIAYYFMRGSLAAYLQFGLLYNFHYAGNWDLGITNPLLSFAFTLPGKFLLAAGLIMVVTLLTKVLKPSFQFSYSWLVLALFAALLSNRPYPHYFLQIIPPLALVMGLLVENVFTFTPKRIVANGLSLSLGLVMVALLWVMVDVIGVYSYPTVAYYQRYLKVMTGQLSPAEYRDQFNSIMSDNYLAASMIKPSADPYLFIWGTNPMLYALSEKIPTGRFTVSFHIQDLGVHEETLADFKAHQPEYVVIMKNESDPFPEFYEYVYDNYIPNQNFHHFTLWKRL